MASAEGGSVSSGVAYGEGCPLSSRLRGLGERRELPQRGTGRSPGRKRDFGVFRRPQNAHFCTYMTKSGGGGQFALASPRSKFWGGGLVPPVPPRDLRPWLYGTVTNEPLPICRSTLPGAGNPVPGSATGSRTLSP